MATIEADIYTQYLPTDQLTHTPTAYQCTSQCGVNTLCTGLFAPTSNLTCTCLPGYIADNPTPLNNCSKYIGCDTQSGCTQYCSVGSNTNSNTTVQCACASQYTLAQDFRTCLLNNPCTSNNGGCMQRCNYVGIAQSVCGCYDGYFLDADRHTCTPLSS